VRQRKASKKPQYAHAFTLFCDGLDFPAIAAQTGLREDLIARCAEMQGWVSRRSRVAGVDAVKAAENRLASQVRTDSALVQATESAAFTLAGAYVKLIEEAASLPTRPYVEPTGDKPSENELYRQSRSMIEAKAQTMKLATSGLRELIETAQNVGLLKVDRGGKTPDGGDDRDKPIDLAKLTQLNIAIVQATGATGARMVAQLAEPTQEVTATPVR
jgi:hypothetical protein